MNKNLLTYQILEPLNGATSARFDIQAGDGNLTIDRVTGNENALASGILQYFEKQGQPIRELTLNNGLVNLTLRGGSSRQRWLHLPWAAYNGATDWQVHLNPTVSAEVTAHSDGGNIKVNLSGMSITRLSADTGGGNVDVILPENGLNLDVSARTGGGNVTIEMGDGITGINVIQAESGAGNAILTIPVGVAARIHTNTGLGKTIVDPHFRNIDKNTYQSDDFDISSNKAEITVKSGAGDVTVITK